MSSYNLIFCAGGIEVYRDPTIQDAQSSFKVRNKDGTEPKNWSLAISPGGYLTMLIVSKQ